VLVVHSEHAVRSIRLPRWLRYTLANRISKPRTGAFMSLYTSAVLGLLFVLFVGILACLEIGFRIGRNDSRKIHELAYAGTGNIEGALFALLGLLLGFSFAGATSRLESRHQLIVREANAISTAYLRLDLLPSSEQPSMRRLFRDYLDARLRAYENFAQGEASEREFARASELQRQIWSQALIASRTDQSQDSARLLLPALNEMNDVVTSREIALKIHLPALVFYLLMCIALLSGLLAGYAMSRRQTRSWLHILLYAAIISVTVIVIFDFDNPRFGLIKVDAADRALIQLRDSIR
jgi:ABC-type glycerol-3-phosphate transport system permease component